MADANTDESNRQQMDEHAKRETALKSDNPGRTSNRSAVGDTPTEPLEKRSRGELLERAAALDIGNADGMDNETLANAIRSRAQGPLPKAAEEEPATSYISMHERES